MKEREAHDAMGKAMSCINEDGKKIQDGVKAGNMMEVEAGNKMMNLDNRNNLKHKGD